MRIKNRNKNFRGSFESGLSAGRGTLFIGKVVRDLEAPIFFAMAIVASVIGMLVWGATKTGRPGGGLLSQFKLVFGTEYGALFAATMIAILINNRRWKGIVIAAATWILMALVSLNPYRSTEPTLDEYFALGAMLSSLAIACCAYYELLD